MTTDAERGIDPEVELLADIPIATPEEDLLVRRAVVARRAPGRGAH